MTRKVRVRFAPSPTGPLHIGGVRTALYNYLFARSMGGDFLVRIEDTDQNRLVPGAEDYIFRALEWLNLNSDENPLKGGPYGPYRQSERKEIYQKYGQELLASGNAYVAFDSPEEIDTMKRQMESEGVQKPQYDSTMRDRMRNSLTMSQRDADGLVSKGIPYVIRIKVPKDESISFTDAVRGQVDVHSSVLDDKVLIKSDGMPTYHLANVVDDYLMQISHVIRGEEWLPSAPLHVLMYQLFGWKDNMPTFAHLPLILKPDGKGKLSKRDSQKTGIPVFPLEWSVAEDTEKYVGFKESGYLPEALVNFLAFLGWNPGTEQELYSLSELERSFSLERIGKSGARFDIDKARWYNEQYLRASTEDELTEMLRAAIPENFDTHSTDISKVAILMKDRVSYPSELFAEARFMFQDPMEFDEKVIRKRWKRDVVEILKVFCLKLDDLTTITSSNAKITLEKVLEERELPLGMIMQPLRVALTGKAGGPDLMEIIEVLGPQRCSMRIKRAIEVLPLND